MMVIPTLGQPETCAVEMVIMPLATMETVTGKHMTMSEVILRNPRCSFLPHGFSSFSCATGMCSHCKSAFVFCFVFSFLVQYSPLKTLLLALLL